MKNTKVKQKKHIPEIPSVSKHPNYRIRLNRSFYSFRIQNEDFKTATNLNTGCHSFVKTQLFGNSKTSLGIITPYEGIPFEIKEIEKYVELLSKIGFKIKFHGVFSFGEIIKEFNGLKQQAENYQNKDTAAFMETLLPNYGRITVEEENEKSMLFFTLDENYENNKACLRYIALCFLRTLFISYEMWFPRMFLTYYDYFKKIKIKPSLDKILIFAYSSPVKHLYNNSSEEIVKITKHISTEASGNLSELKYGYYSFFGSSTYFNYGLGSSFSTLLATSNDFKLIEYLENYENFLMKNVEFTKDYVFSRALYTNNINGELSKTKFINDKNILQNKVDELVLKGEYHKAYVYLKEKVKLFCEITKIKNRYTTDVLEKKITSHDWFKNTQHYGLNKNELEQLFN